VVEAVEEKPVVGVGSCLVGESVRYNGGHKRRNLHTENLQDHLQLVSICPEVGIGLGVPRETIHLVEVDGEIRARDSGTQQRDVTDALEAYADRQQTALPRPDELALRSHPR
jgi:uncharacterized protein YbbK (DUF523 family)